MFIRLEGYPIFVDCGKLVSKLPFLHAHRTNDEFLLLIGLEGPLNLEIDTSPCQLSPRDVMLIPPHVPISGTIPTERLTYFWLHFQYSKDHHILSERDAKRDSHHLYETGADGEERFLIPTHFHPDNPARTIIFSQQLLNFRCCPEYPRRILDHLVGCLIAELSVQSAHIFFQNPEGRDSQRFQEILQWVRVNAHRKISVHEVASTFSYNPDYLSRLFREEIGMSLQRYIICVKLEMVKELLLSSDKPIKEIAHYVSIEDEKYLMRLFKQYEGVTPSEYRNAYSRTKYNTNFRVSKRIDTRWISFLEE